MTNMFKKKAPEIPMPRPCLLTTANIIDDIEAISKFEVNMPGKAFTTSPSDKEDWKKHLQTVTQDAAALKETFQKCQELHEELLTLQEHLNKNAQDLITQANNTLDK